MHMPGFGVLRARILTPFFHPNAVAWWSCLLLRAVVSVREAGVCKDTCSRLYLSAAE